MTVFIELGSTPTHLTRIVEWEGRRTSPLASLETRDKQGLTTNLNHKTKDQPTRECKNACVMKFVMWSIRTFNVWKPPRLGKWTRQGSVGQQSSSLSYAPPGNSAPSQHNQWSILPTLREPRDPWPDYLRGKFSAPQRVLPRLLSNFAYRVESSGVRGPLLRGEGVAHFFFFLYY